MPCRFVCHDYVHMTHYWKVRRSCLNSHEYYSVANRVKKSAEYESSENETCLLVFVAFCCCCFCFVLFFLLKGTPSKDTNVESAAIFSCTQSLHSVAYIHIYIPPRKVVAENV